MVTVRGISMVGIKISVIVPTYNEQKYIGKCISSLLDQDYDDLDIIIVDDGSTDKTIEIVKKYPVNLLTQSHKGAGAARNYGASYAKGMILVFVDADQFFDKSYISELTMPIINGKCIGTHHLQERIANLDKIWALCWRRQMSEKEHTLPKESSIFRAILKDKFLDAGGFDIKKGYFDDTTLYNKLRVKAKGVSNAVCYHHVPETLMEIFNQKKWIGESQERIVSPYLLVSVVRISFPIALLYPYYLFFYFMFLSYFSLRKCLRDKNLKLILAFYIFQIVSSLGWMYGYINWLRKELKKKG